MYRIYQFGAVPLPPAMPEDDLSTGQVDSTLTNTIGAVYDAWGTTQRLPRKQTITFRGYYEISDSGRFAGAAGLVELVDELGNYITDELGNHIILDSAPLSMRRNADLLKAQLGTRQQLFRRREDDGAVEWKQARLLKVGNPREIDDAYVIVKIDAIFETMMAAWRAEAAKEQTLGTPAYFMLDNNGDIPVNDAILILTAITAITTVAISGAGIDLTWAGSLAPGATLAIDDGGKTVWHNGVDAYSGLTRGGGHTVDGWLRVPLGTSYLNVTADGGASVLFSFYEQSL